MAEYYFLASFLPTIELGHIPALGFDELQELLQSNLTSEDLVRVRRFVRFVDMLNIRAVIANEPIDPRGNLKQSELEEALKDRSWSFAEPFADYLISYFTRNHTKEEQLSHFDQLLSRFLLEESRSQKGFAGSYFEFERNLRLVLLGFRAKKLNRDLAYELAFEDIRDPLVIEIMAQKDAKHFEPPFEFRDLKAIFEAYGSHPLELNREMAEYRFKRIQDLSSGAIFSLDRILSYMARLYLVERWLELDVQKGMEVIHAIEKRVVG